MVPMSRIPLFVISLLLLVTTVEFYGVSAGSASEQSEVGASSVVIMTLEREITVAALSPR